MDGTTENSKATAALVAMTDDELAAFSLKLDAALKEARLAPQGLDLNEITDIAATARLLLRSRRAAIAVRVANDIVGDLLGAENE